MFIGKKPSRWLGFLQVACAALIFVVLFVLASDQLCRRDIEGRLPLYPGATVVEAEHDFLRLRALGATRMTLATPDAFATVREWHRQLNLRLLEQGRMRGLADVARRFEPDPDGAGTLIFYSSRCGL